MAFAPSRVAQSHCGASPYKGLGFREIEAEDKGKKLAVTELPVVKG